jgi:hypothetical protein
VQLGNQASKPTVKQHLAAIRQLFDYLTLGGDRAGDAVAVVMSYRGGCEGFNDSVGQLALLRHTAPG